ncbi:hypothetical protein CLOHAE12215_01394 [Clostridium haemolyticum]|uniref:hypothetical protein n=1 Tax=Clostridium TaxID=1485 RepID=UPI001C3BC2D3|nr:MULTISPECIES: hypothetical protein [Clostridium]MCD3216976.1 hypothetical protein [Clostridium botulinum C]CAG7839978.1 hypothetical protein CLOHAE12215_01394 [Clostridium haemolyticum]
MVSGQGLLLELDYADGGKHNYPRTFLIIEANNDYIHMLNVSSLKGKEYKVGFKSNKSIEYYKPPFWKKSFVKLDGLYILSNDSRLESFLLAKHRKMKPSQFMDIKNEFMNYKNNGGNINEIEVDIERVLQLNQPSARSESAYTKATEDQN